MLNLDVALSLEKPRDSHQPEAFALAAKLESDLASNIIGIFGPSGCGKSTLLKVIAGISLTEFSGRSLVSIDEVTQTELGPHQRDVAFVGQKDPLFPHLTVEQNLDFVTRHGAFAADCAFSTQEVIDWCGIHALLPKSVAYLSGGECQRVLFARALLSGKSLLLLDEAFSALDWSARQDMLLLVVKLHREHNLRFILVSHSLKELALSCDHIWQMDAGRLVAEGPSPVMVHQLALNRSAPTLSQLQVRFVARDEEFGVCRWRLDS